MVADLGFEDVEELSDFGADLGVAPEDGEALGQGGVFVGDVGLDEQAGGEHGEEAALAFVEVGEIGGGGASEGLAVEVDAERVVDVEEAADGAAELGFVVALGGDGEAGVLSELGPGAAGAVDVVELEAGLVEEGREGEVGASGLADGAELFDFSGPLGGERGADVVEADVLGDAVELHVAAGG